MVWLLIGCASQVETLRVVSLEVDPVVETDGPITLELHQAWAGEGALRHPLLLVDTLVFEGRLSTEVEVPEQDEGLVLYGWQDLDGDGIHCAPGVDDEPAGVAVVSPWPTFSVSMALVLDTPCVGPERLYPLP